MTDSSLEKTALNIFNELGVSIDISEIKACHRVRPPSRKKVTVKVSRWKDADRVSITLFLLTIVCAGITSVYGPSVREFGPISIYTIFGWQMVP